MIEKLLIFESTGICLFSKNYKISIKNDDDELLTGFLAVLLGYIDTSFGQICCIHTYEKILLIRKTQGIYIILISACFQQQSIFQDEEALEILNRRVENICKTQLALIERKLGTLILILQQQNEKAHNYKFSIIDLEEDLDQLISQGIQKIKIIQKLIQEKSFRVALNPPDLQTN
ncbi:MAG: hypothetical protein JW776_03675 [Candidatus Lokiarchaeota archaeon]|nr:hypothetical protein [Candidatus Lokiarchaeota archaeon]